MPAVRIDVLCECEGCAKRFGVELDLAQPLKDGSHTDFEDMVRDAIMGGAASCYTWGVRGKTTVDRMTLDYNVTIQADLMLCDVCSRKCDELPIDDALTLSQVKEALQAPGAASWSFGSITRSSATATGFPPRISTQVILAERPALHVHERLRRAAS